MTSRDDVRFFVDENTLALGRAIARLRNDIAVIGEPPVDDLLHRGMDDVDWIPIVAAQGWVVITIDHHLRTRPHEATLAARHGLMCVNLRGAGNLSRWDQLVRLARNWDTVETFVKGRPTGPWWLSLTKSGSREYGYKVT